jgi:two-component system sensor histidine kinase YesM
MDKQRDKEFSLKWGLILLVILCWIVPVSIFSAATGYFITQNIGEQIDRTVNLSTTNSVKTAVSQIDAAANSSRYASYNPTIFASWQSYKKGGDKTALYDNVMAFLNQQYKYDEKFLVTTLYFCDNPEDVYYTFNEAYNATYYGVKEYKTNVHDRVQTLSENLGTDIGFLSLGDQVYMVRNIVDKNYKPYAVITMQLNTDTLFSGIENVVWETDVTIWLDDTPVVLDGTMIDSEALKIDFRNDKQSIEKSAEVNTCTA